MQFDFYNTHIFNTISQPMPPHLKTKHPSKNKISAKNHVRIIGGQYKSRRLCFIDACGLRPTADRAREMLFNWLQPFIYDAYILDMFAGSGALGFECLSRGAKQAVFIEQNKAQIALLKQSATALGCAQNAQIINADATLAINQLSNTFDIIFIDPPYAKNLWQGALEQLIAQQNIHNHTLIYLESGAPLAYIENHHTFLVHKFKKIGQAHCYLLQINTNHTVCKNNA